METCSMARTKCSNDTSDICTVKAVSRNSTGRTVHLARTRDSFGTRSCGNRNNSPTQEERVAAARVASGIVEFQIASSSSQVYLPCDTRTEKFEEKEKVTYGESTGDGRKIYMQREEEIRMEKSRDPGMNLNFSGL